VAAEDGITVADDGVGEAVKSDNPLEEGTGDRRGGVGWLSTMKCAYLEKQSTTVKITDLPCTLGRPSMKSMEMSAHTWDGTSRD
jgi:hypothetical protein